MKKNVLFSLCLLISVFSLRGQVTQINSNNSLEVLVPLNNGKTIVISETDSSIWATNATLAGTIPLSADIKFEETWSLVGGKFIFRGSRPGTGSELYISDGTPGGTGLVRDIVAGTTGSAPEDMVRLNGLVYFTAQTAAAGRELWRTDGTSGGTSIVKDILPGAESSNGIDDYGLFSNDSYLLFAARTVSSGIELWKSDGTEDGTVMLKDINPLGDSSNPQFFFKFNNLVLFVATTEANGEEVWKTDGTTGGTVILKDINPGAGSSTSMELVLFPGLPPNRISLFENFHIFNNNVFFRATNGTATGQVWRSDGTEVNTDLLKEVLPGTTFKYISLIDAVNLPSKFIFPISDGEDRSELWESDGTTVGTKLFMAFSPSQAGEPPVILLNFNFDYTTETISQSLFQGNKFFFTADEAPNGRELWISDGTLANTTMVKDINPDAGDGISSGFTSYVYTTNALFFTADDGANGNELWRTDGTEAGTTMVDDINPGGGNSDPELPFFVAHGKIIFDATDGDDADHWDLYVVDGTFTTLPIKLNQFIVSLKDKDALLQWSTLYEVNSKDFTVQRSYDGVHFDDIGNLPASNTSTAKHEYTFTDIGIGNSDKSIIYYRLRASDRDGKSTLTNIIFIKLKGNNGWNVNILSNPVDNYANIMLTGITRELQLSIKDLNGKTFYKNTGQSVNGQLSIPVATLQRGIYLLIAETNNERKVIKFIKQ